MMRMSQLVPTCNSDLRAAQAGEREMKGGQDHGANEVLGTLADGRPVGVREVVEATVSVAALLNLRKCFGVVWPAVGALGALVGGEATEENVEYNAAGPDISALVVRLNIVTTLLCKVGKLLLLDLTRHNLGRHVIGCADKRRAVLNLV